MDSLSHGTGMIHRRSNGLVKCTSRVRKYCCYVQEEIRILKKFVWLFVMFPCAFHSIIIEPTNDGPPRATTDEEFQVVAGPGLFHHPRRDGRHC